MALLADGAKWVIYINSNYHDRDRHLEQIRSNIDKGWKPKHTNNYQISFDDYKFNERNQVPPWMTFLVTWVTINSPRSFGFNTNNNRRNKIDFGNYTADSRR